MRRRSIRLLLRRPRRQRVRWGGVAECPETMHFQPRTCVSEGQCLKRGKWGFCHTPESQQHSSGSCVMETTSTKVGMIQRWGPRCHLALMVAVGLTTACLGVRAAATGGGGWFAKSTAAAFLGVLGFVWTHMAILTVFQVVGLAVHIWTIRSRMRGASSSSPINERKRIP